MRYARGTQVDAAKSRMEIERLLMKAGATEFSSGWIGGVAAVQFSAHGRRVRFSVPLPDKGSEAQRQAETRRRWRCLLLIIKGRLEAAATGIETFEEAFFAHIVTEDGATLFELISRGGGPKLLNAAPGKGSP